MSYADVHDDVVDYGEGEEMMPLPQEGEEEVYDDLYDDVNIGFFQKERNDEFEDGLGMMDDNDIENDEKIDVKPSVVSIPTIEHIASHGEEENVKIKDEPKESRDSNLGVSSHNKEKNEVPPPSSPVNEKETELNPDKKPYSPRIMSTVQSGRALVDAYPKASSAPMIATNFDSKERIDSSSLNVVNRFVNLPMVEAETAPRMMTAMPQQAYTSEGGNTMVFIGELYWWTTDAELEVVLSEYGRVKNLKFFEERVSGKSKGYAQVEFFDSMAAHACRQGMNGRKFHERPCVVALGNPKSIQQMGYQQEKKTQAPVQSQQEHTTTRRNNNCNTTNNNHNNSNNNSSSGNGRGSIYQERDNGRGYGRVGGGRIGNVGNKGGQSGGGVRGRGNYMGKGIGSGSGGMPYGQGHSGPMGGHQSVMMMHQGMMGQGYDPAYGPMGRGGATYGGYVMPSHPYPGMIGPFGAGTIPGVAPHVNPAFFGRPTGIGMMPMDATQHQGWIGEGAWVASGEDQYERRGIRDGSYATEDSSGGGVDHGYGKNDLHEKSRVNGDWPERHRRDDRDGEWQQRDRYREKEKDGYREREKDLGKEEDWERERPTRMRSKSQFVEEEEEDPRVRSRDEDFGKRRRVMYRDLSNI